MEEVWLPCWNGCDPQVVKCGEAYDDCIPADPEPCIATCVKRDCSSDFLHIQSLDFPGQPIFTKEDGQCVREKSDCDCKYMRVWRLFHGLVVFG